MKVRITKKSLYGIGMPGYINETLTALMNNEEVIWENIECKEDAQAVFLSYFMFQEIDEDTNDLVKRVRNMSSKEVLDKIKEIL